MIPCGNESSISCYLLLCFSVVALKLSCFFHAVLGWLDIACPVADIMFQIMPFKLFVAARNACTVDMSSGSIYGWCPTFLIGTAKTTLYQPLLPLLL